jgi:hypothetical protein
VYVILSRQSCKLARGFFIVFGTMNDNPSYLLIITKGGLIMKNTYSKLMLTVLFSFAVLCFVNGQKKALMKGSDRLAETHKLITVKGIVTALDKYTINNAEVTAKKTRSKVFTDSLGRFEILAHGLKKTEEKSLQKKMKSP